MAMFLVSNRRGREIKREPQSDGERVKKMMNVMCVLMFLELGVVKYINCAHGTLVSNQNNNKNVTRHRTID